MKLSRLFQTRPAVLAGRRLYASAAAQARSPGFYTAMGAPDTVEGRFELYSLHVALLLRRLKGQGPQATETAQGLFDAYVQALDDALREMGVGDLSVGKKMRKLGEAFYGRVRNYDEAFAALPDREPLAAIIRRTVLMAEAAPETEPLADYAVAAMARLEAEPIDTLLQGDAPWPTI
ncbi:MAG: ubiquinol-cytochrome C chaperone family protein [Caulobacteraceae bacterium]